MASMTHDLVYTIFRDCLDRLHEDYHYLQSTNHYHYEGCLAAARTAMERADAREGDPEKLLVDSTADWRVHADALEREEHASPAQGVNAHLELMREQSNEKATLTESTSSHSALPSELPSASRVLAARNPTDMRYLPLDEFLQAVEAELEQELQMEERAKRTQEATLIPQAPVEVPSSSRTNSSYVQIIDCDSPIPPPKTSQIPSPNNADDSDSDCTVTTDEMLAIMSSRTESDRKRVRERR